MEFQLLIHTVGSIISAIFSFGLAIFTYFNNPKRTANIMLGLTMAAVGVFYTSHAVGINIADPLASRAVFMWNLSIIFISVFSAHTALAVIGIQQKRKMILGAMYAVSLVLLAFYITYPDAFLEPSKAKLFFPSYYEAGASYHWVMRLIYNLIIPTYFLTEMLLAYRKADFILKNRLKYFFLAMFLGYSTGFLLVLPVFNVFIINPNWGLFFIFFYAVPFVYAVVNYELLDIRLVAKKAFVYGLSVAGVSSVIAFLSFGSSFVEKTYPNFPAWLIPVAAAIVASGVGAFVWRKVRETDVLKYEFITIVTHKFRTPLTRIRWAAESAMENRLLPEKSRLQMENIKEATFRLFELTNVLIGLTDSETTFSYKLKRLNLTRLIKEIGAGLEKRIVEKNISVDFQSEDNCFVIADQERLRPVINIILENAVSYTPAGGRIAVALEKSGSKVKFTVSDTGIGISKEDMPLVFTKFFRSVEAKKADTEGLGIGLYIAKEVIRRHEGKISVFSEGLGKGSLFTAELPAA
ncbi:MAG: Integral membrane sensor signal transduction histidine kinase [Parcubacteria group bacterium GW2011_GWA2_47_21]|nr:MAG: Integral membrane sensor signal transduction histidine kinase [Parcubacteria group bacterium GW2011_GWA2_47_21]